MHPKINLTIFNFFLLMLAIISCQHKNTVKERGDKNTSTLVESIRVAVENKDSLDIPVEEKVNRYTYLHLAALKGNLEAARLLITNKANVNVKDDMGATPLHRAVQSGALEFTKYLLDNGADVDAKSNTQITPLGFAFGAEKSSYEIVQMLILYGANVNAADNEGDISLHWLIYHRNERIAELLINKGANVNAQGWSKQTPLHRCARYGVPGIARILLEHGADRHIRDSTGQDAYDIAVSNADPDHESARGKKEVAKLLLAFPD